MCLESYLGGDVNTRHVYGGYVTTPLGTVVQFDRTWLFHLRQETTRHRAAALGPRAVGVSVFRGECLRVGGHRCGAARRASEQRRVWSAAITVHVCVYCRCRWRIATPRIYL